MQRDDIRVYHRTAQRHRYIIVDASLREDLPSHWVQHVTAPAFLGDDTGRCPALLDLQALEDDACAELCLQLDQQVQSRQECLASLMLETPCDAPTLAAYLRQRLVIPAAARGASPRQFRFFDPGTFLQLPSLLGDGGMVWLMGVVSSVLVPWAGQWTLYDRPVSHKTFSLKASHIQALMRVGVVNRVAMQNEALLADAESWVKGCAAIDAHVLRAMEQHGLMGRDDLVEFASHALMHHPGFDSHPRILALLDQLRKAGPEDELDYRELGGRLRSEEWAGLVQELKQQDKKEAPIS